ncbi:MAG TPA: YybS family protein, partial [Geobacteraceae bacterium]|nr:YybS family protein [Geobacteraceae bacterium]
MKFPDKGTLLDLIKGSVATLTLFLAYVTFPLVGMLPGLFAPFPAIYYALKSGRTTGTAIVVVCAAVMAIMGDATFTLFFILQSGVISLALPAFLTSERSIARAIAYTVSVNLAAIILLAVVYGATKGVNPHTQALKVVNTSISQVATLYQEMGFKGDDLKTLQEGMQQAGALIGRVYPALLVVSLAFIVGLNLLVLTKLSGRLPALPATGDFRSFKNPEQLVWVLIAAGFAMLVKNPHVATAALNVLIVTVALYFIQGMAVISHFFARYAVPKFVRVIFYVLLALQFYLVVAIAALGLFDIWGD